MTCLMDRVLSGSLIKLHTHTSMLGTFFVYIHLGTKYANFQEKIFAEISGKKFQTFDWVKIVDFLIKAYFWVSPDSPGTHCLSIIYKC